MQHTYYMIGEVASLLHIAKNTIRNYEDHGLLTARRKEGNQYRLFSEEDIWMIREIKAFRDLGFSLEEISGLLGSMSLMQMQDMLTKRRIALTQETVGLLQRIQKIDHLQEKIIGITQEPPFEIYLQMMPRFYWQGLDGMDAETQCRWAEQMPYSFICPLLIWKHGKVEVQMGFGISEANLSAWFLSPDSGLKQLGAVKGLVMPVEMEDNDPERLKEYVIQMRDYARVHSFRVADEVLVQGLITATNENAKQLYYSRLWLPVH